MSLRPWWPVWFGVVLVGCPKEDTGDSTPDTDVIDTDVVDDTDPDESTSGALSCSPAHTEVTLSGGAESIQFTATLEGPNGPEPATGATWWLDGPGAISQDGLYSTPADFGGEARISVTKGPDTAWCKVEVTAAVETNASGNASLPGAFGSASPREDAACAPEIVYPLHGSAIPGSFAPPLIQWNANGNDAFALEISTQWNTWTVFTTADQYAPSVDDWQAISRFELGEPVRFRVIGGDWSGSGFNGAPCVAPGTVDSVVADGSIDGTILYWAPPATKSITFAQGLPASNEPMPLPGTCDGCHSVNLARPTRLAYGPSMPGKTNLVDLLNPTSVIQSWGNSFTDMRDFAAPDRSGDYIVVTKMGLLTDSSMAVYRQDTGAFVSDVVTDRSPAMPNWSPDGRTLVYAGCDTGASVMGASDCDLFVQTWDAASESFTGEQKIASHGPGETFFYPTFSPDSRVVAFNAALMWSGPGGTYTSYANPKARLMLVPAGGGGVVELTAANGVGDLTNSWPRWAPAYGTYAWLAFSSKRAYGHQVDGTPQLWVTAVDLEAVVNLEGDPSRAPTWIPGQLITEGNHTPTWFPNKDR